ncbi:MAG TPA: purine-nucleoside phosphorylase [Acidimicrobiales bacterium]|jgi:purine-nucleoside phosphorylase
MSETADRAARTAVELSRHIGVDHHDVLVVLGSGLSGVAQELGADAPSVRLDFLPYFPHFSAPGHRTEAWSVPLGDRRILMMAGRSHLYEEISLAEVMHPLRTGLATGCSTAILTAAVGGLRPELTSGTVVAIRDQINFTGRSPLEGPDFVDMIDAYDPVLRKLALATPGSPIHPEEAVYAQVSGPQFETPAEAAMLGQLGADVVGMSMALETIAARQAGARVLGLAMVTNASAAPDVDVEEVLGTANAAVPIVAAIVRHVVVSML